MGRARTIARRTFLIGSAAIAGGVAFGAYLYRQPLANPLAKGLENGEATFNPWVKISGEKITLITPHGDMGQGVAHMQAILIAEEMDLELGQFEIDFGQPSSAYYNGGFTVEGAETMTAFLPLSEETLAASIAPTLKIVGLQGTGGSSSTIDSYEKLRKAGAVARETLKAAAATKFNVDVTRLNTRAGAVILPDGQEIAYTELAAAAALLEPAPAPALRDPSQWRLVGKSTKRVDTDAKSTGLQAFGIDVQVDGMVHAAVRVNPRRTALSAYDAETAKNMRGVIEILEVTNGIAVIADNTWRAIEAVNAIECTWSEAEYPAGQADHWQALSEALDAGGGLTWRNDGDVGEDTDSAGNINVEYRTPYVAHQPLEPLNATIHVTDDGAVVWTGHQLPQYVCTQVAKITGHDDDKVTFHNQYMGGSFGHRFEIEVVNLCAEIASRMRGTPVKLTYSREEDFQNDFPRQIAMARGSGRVAGGKVESLDLSIASAPPLISQSWRAGIPVAGPDFQIAAGTFNAPYDIQNFRVCASTVNGLAPTSSWRSVGASNGGFFIESLMDELIHEAGGEPIEERLRLCNDPLARGCLEAVAEMSGWGGELGEGRGRGVALVKSFGVPVAEVIEVTNSERGIRIDRVWVACDVGRVIDPVNFESQVQGGVVWGLGHAMNCEITYSDGMAEQTNYHDHEGMRLYQCPAIEVRGLENGEKVLGIGEPPVPPAAPALANAIFAATGKRIRELPLNRHIDFV